MERTRPSPGSFVWRELATGDAERARSFYGELFGWTWKGESMGPAGIYWIASREGAQVAGMFEKPPDMKMPSAWRSYVLTDDVDAAAERCTSAGGSVPRAPADIPGVGRSAALADPWGAIVQPFRPLPEEGAPPRMGPGTFCWESLVTPDPAAAVAFYARVLGLGTAPAPGGEGWMFTAGEPVADVQQASPGAIPRWLAYVLVGNAERSRDLAAKLGGKVLAPRIDVAKVGVVARVADPDGAELGLFEPAAGS